MLGGVFDDYMFVVFEFVVDDLVVVLQGVGVDFYVFYYVLWVDYFDYGGLGGMDQCVVWDGDCLWVYCVLQVYLYVVVGQ